MNAASLLALPAVALSPSVLLLALEVAMGLAPARRDQASEAPPFVVLMPAHDEEEVLAATLDGLLPQLRAGDRLVVIADNCSDSTAAIARTKGAEVTERHDLLRRGKGYALEHGLAAVAGGGSPVVIVVDADCAVAPGGLQALAAQAAQTGSPVQARYEFFAPAGSGPSTRFRAFALRVKNHLRLAGGARLGIPCILTGSGMAFPHGAFDHVKVGSGEVVEDMALGIDLARVGLPARYCPEAVVTSPLPIGDTAVGGQRRRWEGGVMAVALRMSPALVVEGLAKQRLGLVLLAGDIAIPPLSLLMMLMIVAGALCGVAVLGGAPGWIMGLPVAEGVALGGAIAAAWWSHGRDLLSPGEAPAILWQVLKKASFYFDLVRHRPSAWVRTPRSGKGV